MARPVRLGIVGLGFGASAHLPAFLSMPDVKVVAVADAGSGKARQVAAATGVPRAFDGWKGLIESREIDAVSVATPPGSQAAVVCAALDAGKHVLCEKPFGKSVDDARAMWALAKKRQLVNAVDFEFRMEPGIAALKRQVTVSAIGRIRRVDVSWFTGGRADPSSAWSWQHDAGLGGGVLDGFGSHVVDYVEWMCQSPFVRVFARAQILVRRRKDLEGREREVSAEDSCDLLCDLANGAIANLRFSNASPFASGHRIEIVGEGGRLVYAHELPFRPDQATLAIETDARGLRPIPLESPELAPAGLDTRLFPFRQLAGSFIEAISGRSMPDLPDFHRGLRVRRILEAARRSLTDRRQIVIRGGDRD